MPFTIMVKTKPETMRYRQALSCEVTSYVVLAEDSQSSTANYEMEENMLPENIKQPIDHCYAAPSYLFVRFLSDNSRPRACELPTKLITSNVYKILGLKGTSNQMFLRKAVVDQLIKALGILGHDYQFVVFDAFRTRETQLALFEKIHCEQKAANPHLTAGELLDATRRYVAHPDEHARFPIPPHNSGGAVDLALAYKGKLLDFGTAFDELSQASKTDFFEQAWSPDLGFSEDRWSTARHNRRLLFNALKACGFVNYEEEWWHYDLGDCIWSDKLNVNWFYPSMEHEVRLLLKGTTPR